MSRFFQAYDDDSDSDIAEDDAIVTRPVPVGIQRARVLDDSDDEKRVVKSAADKAKDELEIIVKKKIKNHQKIKDMSNLLTDFEVLMKWWEKAKKPHMNEAPARQQESLEKIGKRLFLKTIIEMEDFVAVAWEDKKSLNKIAAKALTTLRQKIKKHNKELEDDIAAYKENPLEDGAAGDDEEKPEKEEEEDSEKEEDMLDDSSSDDDDSWKGDTSEESSTDDEGMTMHLTHLDFLKKAPGTGKSVKDRKVRIKPIAQAKDSDLDSETDGMIMEKPKLFKNDSEMTLDNVIKKFDELRGARGKKGTNRSELVNNFVEICQVIQSKTLPGGLMAKALLALVSAMFEHRQSMHLPMKPLMWSQVLEYIQQLLNLFDDLGTNLILSDEILEEDEELKTAPFRVHGSMLHVLERLDDEFMRILQTSDPYSPAYVERLRDELVIGDICDRAIKYLEDPIRVKSRNLVPLYLRKLNRLYYKHKRVLQAANQPFEDLSETIKKLTEYIQQHDETENGSHRIEATLCHAYHLAIHDKYQEAKLVLCHLQDPVIERFDTNPAILRSQCGIKVMYNRALTQLGLAAFRAGHIEDTLMALKDICFYRPRELLAQGVQRTTYGYSASDKLRILPYHQHINIDSVETAYLVSSLLVEYPGFLVSTITASQKLECSDIKQPKLTKTFYNLLRNTSLQTQTSLPPPDTVKEHIAMAAFAMRDGDWKACIGYLVNDKMNKRIWSLFPNPSFIQATLLNRVKVECLRSWVLQNAPVFDSLEIDWIAQNFEMERRAAYSQLCKMIISNELDGSIEQASGMLIMHQQHIRPVHRACLTVLKETQSLMESNEKICDHKKSISFYKQQSLSSNSLPAGVFGSNERGDGYQSWQQRKAAAANAAGDEEDNEGGGGGGQRRQGGGENRRQWNRNRDDQSHQFRPGQRGRGRFDRNRGGGGGGGTSNYNRGQNQTSNQNQNPSKVVAFA